MLRLQEADSLATGYSSENQRAQHGDRIWRRAVEMPGGFARGIQATQRPVRAEDFGLLIGGEPAESIGETADERVSEIRRLFDPPRPIRLGRRQSVRREPVAARRIEA